MRRVLGFLVLLLAGALPAAPLAAPQALPLFSVIAPRNKMVTGSVLVQAQAKDPRVALVKWCVDDWAKTTPPPFDFVLDVGNVPAQRHVRAIALDRERHPLYEGTVTLNPGERGLELAFVEPVPGQAVSGPTPIQVEAVIPADDSVQSIALEVGDKSVPLEALAGSDGLFGTVAVLPGDPVPLVARVTTKRGRHADATLVANVRGATAEADAHVVEQMVGVYKGSDPLTKLKPGDFKVRDDAGECDVRNVSLVQQTPVAIGFAVDTSLSLRHHMKLLSQTADRFLAQCFRPSDTGFVMAFGPFISKLVDWTSDSSAIKARLEALPEPSMAGTALYETIVKALYQFQGSQGSRALVLLTDGYDFDGDVSEDDALAYAKQSGVKIYALALSTQTADAALRTVHGKEVTEWTYSDAPPNLPTLKRFAEATGGRVIEVKKAEDLGPAFDRIQRDLRTQYLVSFVSRAHERGAFHPVEISSKHGKVVTAAGFYY